MTAPVTFPKLGRALATLVLAPATRSFLERRDPKALEQAERVLVEAFGEGWQEYLAESAEGELRAHLDTTRCQEHFDVVVAFAKRANKWEGDNGLRRCLDRLVQLGRESKPVLFKDFAPHSFEFSAGGLQGGLIFHGQHDGGGTGSAPTFAVTLEPCDGWSLHT